MVFDYVKVRLNKLFDKLKLNNLDAIFISNRSNVTYLSGFRGTDAYLLIAPNKKIFITDFRFIQQAKLETRDFEIVQIETSFFDSVSHLIKDNNFKNVGFEAKSLSYAEHSRLYKLISPNRLIPVFDLIEDLRQIKDSYEIRLIKESIKIAGLVWDIVKKKIKAGISEMDFSKLLDNQMRSSGAERPAFPTIIASGPHASIPHAIVSKRKIQQTDFVIVDFGARLHSYHCDVTRTFSLSKLSAKKQQLYNIVKDAHDRAIKAVRPGIEIAGLDAVARDYIRTKGFLKEFGHALGHGIGLDVHEAPHISSREEGVLMPGMVFTIEPALYLEGFTGIRIEDMILVTQTGCEVMTGDID